MKKVVTVLLVMMLVITGCGSSSDNQSIVGINEGNVSSKTVESAQTTQDNSAATCSHEWKEATCELPETCALCGETRGEALGHKWDDATWPIHRTCTVCGATEEDVTPPDEGSIVTFGSYEQDNDLSNGSEPIEWVVLDVQDGKALLLSKYILDMVTYNTAVHEKDFYGIKTMTPDDVTWETSDARSWCNDTFYNIAFSDDEKKQIAETTLSNPDNPYYGTEGGNDTNDKVFCLSLEEVNEYFTFDNWNSEEEWGFCQALLCETTEYARNLKTDDTDYGHLWTYEFTAEEYESTWKDKGYTEDCIGMTTTTWWLRTPGSDTIFACVADDMGEAGKFMDAQVNFPFISSVRPALWVNY